MPATGALSTPPQFKNHGFPNLLAAIQHQNQDRHFRLENHHRLPSCFRTTSITGDKPPLNHVRQIWRLGSSTTLTTYLPQAAAVMEVDTHVPSGNDGQGGSSLIRYLETKFPLELFFHLTDFMDDSSILNLRLASRGLERALLPTFQKRFFARRHICLTERSLRRVAAISDQPKLAGHVSSVSVGCIHSSSDIEQGDDAVFIECSFDVEYLTHAFAKMPGLRDVTIHYRPFPPRLNASRNVAFAVARESPRKLLRKLLRSLSEAGRELESFDMEIEGGGTGGGFYLLDLHFSDSLFEFLSRPLRSLKRLSLALDPRPGAAMRDGPNDAPQLKKLLEIPRALEHLRLNLDRDSPQSTFTILESLTLETPSSLLHLTRLDLGKITTTVDTLVEFVRAVAKSLNRLQLYRIGLRFRPHQDYPPDHLIPDPTGDPPHVQAGLWKMVFQRMAAMPELEKLNRFSASCLTERVRKDHVAFRQALPGGEFELRPGCEYTGTGARGFIQELRENVVVRSPRPSLPPPWVDAGDDDDDDDEPVVISDDDGEETDEGSDSG